jgi:uncharacterized protein YecA (UPF0149 family)
MKLPFSMTAAAAALTFASMIGTRAQVFSSEITTSGNRRYKPRLTHPVEGKYHGTGRNAPCPCGSGKKYKHCHLRREA